ncbi:Carbamoyltransferase HypF [Caloramator mitchellensis]|uniref:Carbamoyltransferase n=1 Tax=Caloramator mitchellensis TaxID=908809 RepID=A0A0R3JSY3_CALMK|nr:carbamoyltransferase HypF [Caloramator mitchellensis]KRQ86617.1 Carbamoyltransferase HypF [Caloramator mitchellensis]
MKRSRININGIVQGVGFRPFINKLVTNYCLKGWVKNTSQGVMIEVEGDENSIYDFINDIKNKSPKLAYIEKIEYEFCKNLKFYNEFQIEKSHQFDKKFTFISPDVGICDDCLAELFDKNDRRYRYPFINCTNCGPRFTIIKDVPYDREKTTMRQFEMCHSCYNEYVDIEDRRYHAQPNCCYICGPEVFFSYDNEIVSGEVAIKKAIDFIKQKKIIAIKGLGGFHVACDALDEKTVTQLRLRKGREEKPFAIMVKDIITAEKFCIITDEEKEILSSFRRPIVLLKKKNNLLDYISDNDSLGVMLPYTPLHYLIMENFDVLVMTSGNEHDIPIYYKNEDAVEGLKNIADGFLMNNRDIHVRCDDSIVKVFEGKEYFIRRSRGYVPFPIKFDVDEHILACGAEQKGAFALSKSGFIFSSQHIGELRNIETFEHYSEAIEHYKKIFDIKPSIIVCDMHPDYLSSNYAINKHKENKTPLIKVQHHHAHMAACMADNNLNERVIGIIWDGTGYGLDSTIWGGEFLIGDYKDFKRVGSIKKIALPGGDRATKEIYKIKYSLLKDSLGNIPDDFVVSGDKDMINKMIDLELNTPRVSSMGRLFDGVASIIGIKDKVSYEGQAAILLESLATVCDDYYRFNIIKDDIIYFDWKDTILDVVYDVRKKVEIGKIAAKFMNTLVRVSSDMVKVISNEYGIRNIVLSGGVFQNIYILRRMKLELEKLQFKVYIHNKISTNDEGIPLGQIAVAAKGGGEICV